MIQDKWAETIKTILSKKIDPDFIILFGSYATGKTRENSDLDLAFFTEKDISDYERFIIAQELADAIKVEVDLIDIIKVDTVFAAQIFFNGTLIACKDENQFIKQRMRALSMYATLNEQRKDLLKAIDERGYIYEE